MRTVLIKSLERTRRPKRTQHMDITAVDDFRIVVRGRKGYLFYGCNFNRTWVRFTRQ